MTYPELLADLQHEYDDLCAILRGLPEESWDLPTPAEGWAVRDQVSHLAYFDDAARFAVTDGAAFSAFAAEFVSRDGDPMAEHLGRGRGVTGSAVLAWFEEAHESLATDLEGLDPSTRVPWFGPPMGLMSFVSARLMETWAHGQDVADAVGAERAFTERLRHIAHLGVRARPYSYLVRGLEVPSGRIDVTVTGPTGDEWSWVIGEGETAEGSENEHDDSTPGADQSAASVTGSALDFCLVVTQRRHVADTALVVSGDLAVGWMDIAQAFAGPAGQGRAPSR